jgi:hypothetical protein
MPKFLVLVGTAFLVATILVRVNADLNLTLLKAKEAANTAAVLAAPGGNFAHGEGQVLGESTSSPDADNSNSIQNSISSGTTQTAKITEDKAASIKQSIRDILDRLTQLNTAGILSIQNQLNSHFGEQAPQPATATILPGVGGFAWNNDASLSLAQGNITVTQGSITVGNTKLFANGNVGVNTLSPAATLDVSGTLNVSGASTLPNLNFTNATGTTLNLTNLTVSSCTGCGGVAGGSSGQIPYNNGGVFAGDSSLVFSSTTKLFTLTGTSTFSGKVSIGTTTPSGVFNVAGATTTTYLSVTNGGLVGIGTSTPNTALSIQSSIPIINLTKPGAQTYQIRNGGSGNNFDIFDKTNNASRLLIDTSGQFLVGTTTNVVANGSKMFVYGGANGANIDVMGDPAVSDQAVIELEGSDYFTPSGGQSSAALRYYGPANSFGTTLGFTNQRLGLLDFGQASTSIITNFNATPIIFGTNAAERMRLTASGTLVIGTTTQVGIFNIGSATTTNYFNVNQAGQVGIGTTTPAYRLVVGDRTIQSDIAIPKGAICVDDATGAGCPASPVAGTVYASTTAITAIDLAENYSASDSSIEAGDVVSVDPNNQESIIKADASSTDKLLGIISTAPGVLLGRKIQNSKPVALAGRVPVKVNLENGPIHIGDRLTVSSLPGIATRQTESGESVGVALQNYDQNSSSTKIQALVKVGFAVVLTDTTSTTPGILSRFAQAVKNAISQIRDLVLNSLTANTVITNQLCLGSTCIQEPDLQRILNNSGVSPSAPPAPTPETTTTPGTTSSTPASTSTTPDTSTSTPPEPVLETTSTATSTL